MVIAIPVFDTRISPRFDCASGFWLVRTSARRQVLENSAREFDSENYIERINHLKGLGVEVVICGGLSSAMQDLMLEHNIAVIAWVSGSAQKALQLYCRGKLIPGAMLCPGQRMRQWGGGGRQKRS